MKILVTGAAGFLGGRTVKHFAAERHRYTVLATSRRTERAAEFAALGGSFMPGDLCDLNFCDTITKNVDIVIHCAALSSPYGAYQNFYNSNFVATQVLLNSCLKNGVHKFIFISTPSIYFNFSDRWDVKESDKLPEKMVNAYAETKLLAEEFVLSKNSKNFQTIALRPRAIIGAEDTVLFPRMLTAYNKGRLKIIGNGQNVCDMTCVRNVIEAICCTMAAPYNAFGEAYNITDGESVNFWEAVNYALTALGYNPIQKRISKHLASFAATVLEQKALLFAEKKEPTLTKYGVGILSHSFTLNISKAINFLNYQPVMNTFDGINEYVLWHKKHK